MCEDEDILKNTWAYQEIFQKGFLQGREEVRQEELQYQRRTLLRLVQLRFPKLTKLAKKCAKRISDPVELHDVIIKMFSTKTKKETKLVLPGIDSEREINTPT